MTCVCDRATLDLNVRHMSSEMSSLNEQQVRQLREKDTELRRLKKTTLQLKIARDGLQLAEQTQENKKAEVSHRLLCTFPGTAKEDAREQMHPRAYEQICSVCWFQMLLLDALCIKNVLE